MDGGWILPATVAAYLLLIAAGTFLLRGPDVREGGGRLGLDRALFLATSATSLTGFQQSIGFNDFRPDRAQGPAILLFLTIAGSLLAMTAGALAAVRVLRLPFSDWQVIAAALIAEALALLVGTAALFGDGFPDSLQQAASAFGNSGAVITARGHNFPAFHSTLAQTVLLPLAVLGGLGLPVLMELYYFAIGRISRLSTHSRTVITLAAGIYIAATLILFIPARLHAQALASDPVFMASHPAFDAGGRAAFMVASTAAINTRTAGLPFNMLDYFSTPMQWLLVLLMMIGASPAGTGGGLKATTALLLLAGFRDVLRGRPVPRTFGIAGAWLAVYLLVAGVGFVCLCSIESSLSAAEGAFITISALSNVGLSHGPVMIVGSGMYVLTMVMFVGRLAPLCVLWWMARTTPGAEVLVG
jgi:trk system potassium uptake protein TrkH